MVKTKSYRNDATASIHEIASDLHQLDLIDKATMRRFDESCLTPIVQFTSAEIRALREREQVSQDVLAHYLNISKDSVSQWERGLKQPAGTALKLLTLVAKNGLSAIA
ncbi:MAG: putative transcriptional regulator [Hyphomonadaceae bacterium]|nr:MAG: putative transcriptional regulator [Hyphomonadaceae bacterium]KAF0183455.1 MAG: putative transcriptional regulator [Hyphomonadaceae bacterium]